MNNFDALTKIVWAYIRDHDGQTILLKNISAATAITPKTVRKKINFLVDNGYIRQQGKNYFVLKKEG